MKVDVVQFNKAIKSNQSILLSCNCTVSYSGRANSRLLQGDRIVILKADNTLLIHQPHGSNPINYMKESASHKLIQSKDKLILKSRALKEYISVVINTVHSLQYLDLKDNQKIQLSGSERDMAEMIFKNPALISPGFKPLSLEEHTKYGFIDVFGYDKGNILTVIECKRYAADLKAVDQLHRYVKKVKQLRGLKSVRGIIAAPKISANALKMLQDNNFEFRKIDPPKYLEKFAKDQKRLKEYNI